MKYRLLSTEELSSLETEFIHFLVANGIDAPLWEKIKANDKPRTDELIALFSDMVLDNVLQKIEFIENKRAKIVQTIRFLPDKMVCAGIVINAESDINLTQSQDIEALVKGEKSAEAKYFITENSYQQSREQDLFLLLETGFLISDERLFNALQAISSVK